jgi:tRNA U34 5-carboxymethylaminomethyl modifying enzyme MnmG/GidA
MQVKLLIKGFQELRILEKGKSIQYNYLNPTAIGPTIWLPICSLHLVLNVFGATVGDQNLT